jgi:acetyl-CoA carboxylase carboxyl transferase subunit alpha
VYSVISPEGCASILWRDPARAEDAATAMKITAADLKGLGIVDEIVPEPAGGAHVDHDALFRTLDVVIESQLKELRAMAPADLVAARYEKFRNMGRLGQDFFEEASYTMPAVTRSTLPDAEAGEAGAEAESETEA